jgi:hypothetical protein
MLLPLDTINKFLVSRFINVKRVQYKKSMIFSDVSLLKSNDGYTKTYACYYFGSSSIIDHMIEETYLKLYGAKIQSLSWNRIMI